MYGNEQDRLKNAAANEANKDTSTLYPVEGHQKESGGILKQITNPSGNK